MTTPAKPAEIIIPTYNIEMKSTINDFMGKPVWTVVGGPYEREEADGRIEWLEEKHGNREYRLVRADV